MCVILLVAITASNPMYTEAILQRTLDRQLTAYLETNNRYPMMMTLRVNAMSHSNVDLAVYEEQMRQIPDAFGLPQTELLTHYSLQGTTVESSLARNDIAHVSISLGMLSDIDRHITIVGGRLFSPEPDADGIVDVIVSDVMMEPVSGMELCRRVKHDVELSHIPLILLTALTTEQAKMEGMESGADAYIEKPFSMDYLLTTIDNLLHERQSVKRAYSESPFTAPESVSISQADNEFLHRLEKIIERELTNSELNVDMLANGMNMSRSSLNRKIRGTLNVSPNDFIRIERLKRAAALLKQGQTRVADVCYQVGFSTPSYFTKCFYRQFGLLPKDFISS